MNQGTLFTMEILRDTATDVQPTTTLDADVCSKTAQVLGGLLIEVDTDGTIDLAVNDQLQDKGGQ